MVDESTANIDQFLPGLVFVMPYSWTEVTQWWHPKRVRVRKRYKALADESVMDDGTLDEEETPDGAGESTDEDAPPVEDLHE